MSLKTIKKIQINLILLIAKFLNFLDIIGGFVRKQTANFGRISSYLILSVLILTSFFVSGKRTHLSSIVDTLSSSDEVLGVAGSISRLPKLVKDYPLPEVTAKSIYAVDVRSGRVLVDVNSNQKLPPASTTKLMTALVALDVYGIDEQVGVSSFCTKVEGLKAGLHEGDSFPVRDYLKSLLIFSAADSACTLSLGKVPYTEFLARMNQKAKSLGLTGTTFTNTIGLDSANGNHLSTAKDLFVLGNFAMKQGLIREIVGTKEFNMVNNSGFDVTLHNTNELLWYLPGSIGIKTGRTEGAGEVLLYEYAKDNVNLIIVVMGSENRFEDTQIILNWILNAYSFY